MITEEEFLKSIKTIEAFMQKQDKTMKSIYNALEMDGHPILMFGNEMIYLTIDLLASHFFDGAKEGIYYYLFECIGTKEGRCIEVDGIEYIIKTPEDLYNYLIT
jgi:hypothetical protein